MSQICIELYISYIQMLAASWLLEESPAVSQLNGQVLISSCLRSLDPNIERYGPIRCSNVDHLLEFGSYDSYVILNSYRVSLRWQPPVFWERAVALDGRYSPWHLHLSSVACRPWSMFYHGHLRTGTCCHTTQCLRAMRKDNTKAVAQFLVTVSNHQNANDTHLAKLR